MTVPTLTLFGGTGYLGRRIANRALDAGWLVRIAARRQRPDLFNAEARPLDHVSVDARDPESVQGAVSGAAAAVNAVSLYVESRAESFRSIHLDAAARIAEAAQAEGARLVHVSGIGVDKRSSSPYVRARALGEARVREACPHSVVVRPSVLFGDDDAFLSAVTSMIKWLPVVPVFGAGDCRLQPVHVDDAARAVVAALALDDAPGAIYELGGPDVFTYRELLEAVAARQGRRRLFLPIPFVLWRLLALIVAPLADPPITRDQLELLRHDNIATANRGFEELGIGVGSLTSVPQCVRSG